MLPREKTTPCWQSSRQNRQFADIDFQCQEIRRGVFNMESKMAHCQITCITKPNVHSAYEHITHVGNPAWTTRRITVENCISNIRRGVDTFYVQDARGNVAQVVVVNASGGVREHIRTVADGRYTDNLLSLNQCSL